MFQVTDAHMHIGDFDAFDVRLHHDALAAYMAEYNIDTGIVFCPDNAQVQQTVAKVPAAYGLYWANPKSPDAVKEAADYLDDPLFRGIKLHPVSRRLQRRRSDRLAPHRASRRSASASAHPLRARRVCLAVGD